MNGQVVPLGGQEPAGQESLLAEIIMNLDETGLVSEQDLELPGLEGRAYGGLEGQEPRAGVEVPEGYSVELVLELEEEFAAQGQAERGRQVVGPGRGLELPVDRRHPGVDPIELGIERPPAGLVDPRAAFDLVGEPGHEFEPRRIARQRGIVRGHRIEVDGRAFSEDAQVLLSELQGEGRANAFLSDAGAADRPRQGLAVDPQGLLQGGVMARGIESVGLRQPGVPVDAGLRRGDGRLSAGGAGDGRGQGQDQESGSSRVGHVLTSARAMTVLTLDNPR
jgi:hypothetical protein